MRLGATLGGFVAGTAVTSLVAVFAMRSVFVAADRVTAAYADDVAVVATLRNAAEREASSGRAYLIAGDETVLRRVERARDELRSNIASLGRPASAEDRRLIEDIVVANEDYESALDRVVSARRSARDPAAVERTFDQETQPAKDALTRTIGALAQHKQQQLIHAERTARTTRTGALAIVVAVGGLAVVTAAGLAVALARSWRTAARQRDELATLLARVEQSNQDLEAFAGRVAHDVRNALGPLAVASSLLQQPNLPRATVERMAAAVSRAVERARGLVDGLLAFSRADRDVDPLAHTSVASAVASAIEELSPLIVQTNATVVAEVEDVEVCCPRALLNVVVTNVVGNAVKFLRDRPERSVRISSQVLQGGCELRIDDTGPGIPEEACLRIFEPFFRVPGTVAPGTGIGLATVRRIVDAHAGRVTVSSKVGVGASFSVWLPLSAVTGTRAAPRECAPS